MQQAARCLRRRKAVTHRSSRHRRLLLSSHGAARHDVRRTPRVGRLSFSSSPKPTTPSPFLLRAATGARLVSGLAIAGGGGALLAEVFERSGIAFPPGIAGMMLTCGGFVVCTRLSPTTADRLLKFFQPSINWVSLHLSMLFAPALVMLPTLDLVGNDKRSGGAGDSCDSSGSNNSDTGFRLLSVVAVGWAGSYLSTIGLCRAVFAISKRLSASGAAAIVGKTTVASAKIPATPDARAWMTSAVPLWAALAAIGAPSAFSQPENPEAAFGFLLGLTGLGYSLGFFVPVAIRRFFPPVTFCMALTWGGANLLASANSISYKDVLTKAYNTKEKNENGEHRTEGISGLSRILGLEIGAGGCVLKLLDASLLIAGIQAFQFLPLIRSRIIALSGVTFAAAGLNLVGMAAFASLADIRRDYAVASLTRGVTTAMALPINKMLSHGIHCEERPAVTAGVSTTCGLLGAILIPPLAGLVGIGSTSGFAATRGIAAGASAHGLGAAVYAGNDPRAFVFGVVSFGLVGAWSAMLLLDRSPLRPVILACLPSDM